MDLKYTAPSDGEKLYHTDQHYPKETMSSANKSATLTMKRRYMQHHI